MKKVFFVVIVLISFWSCSKSDDSGTTLLTGKWYAKSEREKIVNSRNGVVISDQTINYPTGSYLDFRKDGKVYSYLPGGSPSYDTTFYIYSGNSIKIISLNKTDTTNLQVLKLTSSQLEFYSKLDEFTQYKESWLTATK